MISLSHFTYSTSRQVTTREFGNPVVYDYIHTVLMNTTSCSTVIVFKEFVDEPKIDSCYVLYINIAFITVNVVDLVSFIHVYPFCRKCMRFEFTRENENKGDFLMSSLMLFQDLAPANLSGLKGDLKRKFLLMQAKGPVD